MSVLKPIKNYEGYYCDEEANIFRHLGDNKYRQLSVIHNPESKTSQIFINNKITTLNRLVYLAWIGDIEPGKKVVKKDHNKPPTPDNLELAVSAKKGGMKREIDPSRILELFNQGITPSCIAKRFNMSTPAVCKITKEISEGERRYEYDV